MVLEGLAELAAIAKVDLHVRADLAGSNQTQRCHVAFERHAGSARPIASAAIAAEARKFLVICSPNWNVHVVR